MSRPTPGQLKTDSVIGAELARLEHDNGVAALEAKEQLMDFLGLEPTRGSEDADGGLR